MRAMRACHALLLSAVSLCGFAAPEQGDLAYLQNGVHEMVSGNNNGSLIVFGDQAFPVVNGRSDGGATEPVIGAARLGRGRIVVMGDVVSLEQDVLRTADTGRLMAHILRWAAGEKTAPRVGIYRVGGLVQRLKALPSGLSLDARNIELDQLKQADTVVLAARFLTGKDVAPLDEFVRAGGGMVIAGAGSYLEEHFAGMDLATQAPCSRLTAPAGILWARGAVQRTSAAGFHVEPPPDLSHAGKALAAFEESEAGKRHLSSREEAQVYATLFRAIWDLPHDNGAFYSRLDRVLAPFEKSAIPTAAMPVARDDTPWRLAIVRATQRLRWTAPEEVRAHPAAAEFPGVVPAGAPRTTATIRIQTSGGRWGELGTGLYAAPGEVITVTVPQKAVDQGLGLVIGVHSDLLWGLDEWSRMPDIILREPFRSTQLRAASAFGGAIYIGVPERANAGDFDVTISGGVPAPHYIDGKTAPDEWRTMQRNLPAPWAEIESDKVILSVPSRLARDLDDPAALMAVWNTIIDLVSDLAAVPRARPRAERLVPDVQISFATLHSGYPIMMYLPKAQTLVSREELLRGRAEFGNHNRSMWGLPHELAHQVQNPAWSFDGTTEPTAQLFAIYVMDKLCHIPVAENQHASAEFRAAEMARYNFAAPEFAKWKGDQWIALTTYLQLQQAFGWEAFQAVFAQYAKLTESEKPKNDNEKRDQWMVRFSRQVHRNLGPFFQTWGIPTSDAARASIADLPAWMPDELPVPKTGAAAR